jgi:hypothetical protein
MFPNPGATLKKTVPSYSKRRQPSLPALPICQTGLDGEPKGRGDLSRAKARSPVQGVPRRITVACRSALRGRPPQRRCQPSTDGRINAILVPPLRSMPSSLLPLPSLESKIYISSTRRPSVSVKIKPSNILIALNGVLLLRPPFRCAIWKMVYMASVSAI